MRFSAAIQPQQPLHTVAGTTPRTSTASDFIRRIVAGELVERPLPAPVLTDDLPADLDQRVRLVGEW